MRETAVAERDQDETEARYGDMMEVDRKAGVKMDAEIAQRAAAVSLEHPDWTMIEAIHEAAEQIAVERPPPSEQDAQEKSDAEPGRTSPPFAGLVDEARTIEGAAGGLPPARPPGGAGEEGIEPGARPQEPAPRAPDEAVEPDEKTPPFQRRESDDDIEAVRAELQASAKRPLPPGWVQTATLPNHAALSRLAAAFGKRVVGVRLGPNAGDILGFSPGGLVLSDRPGVIYIFAGAKEPHLNVFGHELLHQLRRDAPDFYAEFGEGIKAIIVQEGFGHGFAPRLLELGTPRASLSEEFLAELVGDGFLDQRFWNTLGRENRSLVARIPYFLNLREASPRKLKRRVP